MKKQPILCPKCNKLKNHHSGGVCNWCYRRYFWKRKLVKCKRCERMLPHQSKGFCAGCYNYVFHLDNAKAWSCRKYHNISIEIYKQLTKACLICGFKKVVELHHIDLNHKNNSEENLVGICPNHHKMIHNFALRDEVLVQLNRILRLKKYQTQLTFTQGEVSANIQEELESELPLPSLEADEQTLETEAPENQPIEILIRKENSPVLMAAN